MIEETGKLRRPEEWPDPKKENEDGRSLISKELDALEKSSEINKAAFNNLLAKLAPILSEAKFEPSLTAKPNETPICGLGERIRKIREAIELINLQMEGVLSRLEL